MKRMLSTIGVVLCITCVLTAAEQDPSQVLPGAPSDARLGKPKDLNGYFPMTVPADRKEWEQRRSELREQVLVGTGLWPMPASANRRTSTATSR